MTTLARPRRKPAAAPLALHVLTYPDEGQVLAHVLETDVVSQGETADAALRNVVDALTGLFDVVAKDSRAQSPFERPAPAAFWRALRGARLRSSSPIRLRGCGPATLLAYRLDETPEA